MSGHRFSPLSLAVFAVAACGDPTAPYVCDPLSPGPSLSADRLNSLPPVSAEFQTQDDQWAEISNQVPGGWGGIFFEDGVLTIYLVDTTQRAVAIAELTRRGVAPELDLSGARVIQGRWSFVQLYDWYRWIHQEVGWPDGLVSTDIDELRNRLAYGVVDAAAKGRLEQSFADLELPCELAIVEISAPVIPRSGGRP